MTSEFSKVILEKVFNLQGKMHAIYNNINRQHTTETQEIYG